MNHVTRLLPRSLLMLAALAVASTPVLAKDTPDEERAEMRKERDDVLKELYKLNPSTQSKVEKAVGYAVFTNLGVNVFVVSAGGGHGIVVSDNGKETFMKMGQAGVGLGLGVKDFRAVFVFNNKEKLQKFIDTGWDFGAEADAAAKAGEKGGAAEAAGDFGKDVEVYQITKNGLALQATLNGTKYWKDGDLN
jgi:lipid-binding SYLF domain-containing protein